MPGVDGFDVLRRVAETPGHIGRVLVTGYREYMDKVPDDRAPWFLVIKPYDPDHLLRVIERAWSATKLRRSATEVVRATQTEPEVPLSAPGSVRKLARAR
jgi:DNA-binding NtrC family response regulator